MSHQSADLSQPVGFQRIGRVCIALCAIAAALLGFAVWQGSWFIEPGGRGSPLDFVNGWAAGRLVLDGHPAAAYDPLIHKQVEDAALGHVFAGSYEWFYPPHFLFVAALLALVPYLLAFPLWLAATLPVYVATMRWIAGNRLGLLLAGACPATLANMLIGQNGFVTAALVGGALGLMERRPVWSGLCLGLLTYKPHFGLLFPLVLIVTGRWIVFVTAAAVTVILLLASWLVFGSDTWHAFFLSIPDASHGFLSQGVFGFAKLQSLYALLRVIGVPETIAWACHLSFAVAIAIALCLLWRSTKPFALKAAALALATLLVTPYLFFYDLTVLAIALAFVVRLAGDTGFRAGELPAFGLGAALLLVFPIAVAPVGLGAMLLLGIVIVRRAFDRMPMARTSIAETTSG